MNVYVLLRRKWRLFAECPDQRAAADLAISWATICPGTRFAYGQSLDALTEAKVAS